MLSMEILFATTYVDRKLWHILTSSMNTSSSQTTTLQCFGCVRRIRQWTFNTGWHAHSQKKWTSCTRHWPLPKYTCLCQDGANYKQRAKKQRLIIVLIRTLHGAGYGAIRSGIWQLLFIYSIKHIYTGSTQWDNINSVLQCCSVTIAKSKSRNRRDIGLM